MRKIDFVDIDNMVIVIMESVPDDENFWVLSAWERYDGSHKLITIIDNIVFGRIMGDDAFDIIKRSKFRDYVDMGEVFENGKIVVENDPVMDI